MTPAKFLNKYEQALASQNWDAVRPLLHDDVCVTFNNGTFKGIEEVQGVFESNFRAIKDEQYSISNEHWVHISKTSAVCIYHFQWTGIIKGEHCSGGGRGTTVLKFDSDRWQIITEHLGPNAG